MDSKHPVKNVDVRATDLLRVLNDHVEGSQGRFLYYKGHILSPTFSFMFYNIKDGDQIMVLRYTDKNKINKLSVEGETEFRFDDSLVREYARLLDLETNRLESRRKFINGVMGQLDKTTEFYREQKADHVSLIPLSAPATQVLPTFWGSKSRRKQESY